MLNIVILMSLSIPSFAQGQLVGGATDVISIAEAEKQLAQDNVAKRNAVQKANDSTAPLEDGLRDALLGGENAKTRKALAKPDLSEKVAVAESVYESKQLGEIGTAMNTARQAVSEREAEGGEVEQVSLFKAVISLIIVLALILVIAYLIRRFMPQMRTLNRRLGLEVVGRTPLGPKQSISLVKVGSKVMLVGMSPGHTTCLAMIDSPDEIALVLGQIASGQENALENDFDDAFMKEAMQYDDIDELKDAQAMQASKELSGLMRKVKGLNKMR